LRNQGESLGLAMIEDVLITPLDIIETSSGRVMHAMKKTNAGFFGFGEVYFSHVEPGAIRAWKRHKEMTLNLVVPKGEVRFVLFDDRNKKNKRLQEVIISKDNYCRLTVPPLIWVGFQNLSEEMSIVLNIANIEHDSKEVERLEVDKIEFNWSID
jgi:dTDP-4-dehydrorhamnose 3,5-epimerase